MHWNPANHLLRMKQLHASTTVAKRDRMHRSKWGVNALKAHHVQACQTACHGYHGPVWAVNSGFSVLKVYRRLADGWQGWQALSHCVILCNWFRKILAHELHIAALFKYVWTQGILSILSVAQGHGECYSQGSSNSCFFPRRTVGDLDIWQSNMGPNVFNTEVGSFSESIFTCIYKIWYLVNYVHSSTQLSQDPHSNEL